MAIGLLRGLSEIMPTRMSAGMNERGFETYVKAWNRRYVDQPRNDRET